MNDFDWQEAWENSARQEYEYYALASDEQLLTELKNGAYGSHYRIWEVICNRGNKDFVWPLLEALKNLKGTEYFHDRQHCTDAILSLTEIKNRPIRERILGPSTAFNDEIFQQALKDFKKKILNKLPQIH